MESQYYRRLPATLRGLVDEIEDSAHAEIGIELASPLEGHPDSTAAANMSWGSAAGLAIRCRGELDTTTPAYPEPFALACHELLHLRRYVVERAPVVYKIDTLPDTAPHYLQRLLTPAGIELVIEHSVIERRAHLYGFPFAGHTSARESWRVLADLHLCEAAVRPGVGITIYGERIPPTWGDGRFSALRWFLMYEWMNADLLDSDAETRDRAERVLKDVDLLAPARWFTDVLRDPGQCGPVRAKEHAAVAACIAYDINPSALWLSYWAPSGIRYRIQASDHRHAPELIAQAEREREQQQKESL